MKKSISILAMAFIACVASAQNMHVKKFNYTSFRKTERIANELLSKKSSATAKQHPEYGLLPYNAQCAECVELIDKRTIDSRLFIDPKNDGHTYSQQSYFPLHYKKNSTDIWRTIDPRLRPVAPGLYIAADQPVPTKCDLNNKSTSINERGFEFEFNKNLSLYFFDDNTLYTQKQAGNYSNYTIGEEGLNVKNIWPGIEMEQIFTAGQIKTNFIIAAPLQLPVTSGWMVIEDHFTLPTSITISEDEHGSHLPGGYYRGDYLLKNEKGETLITYEKPVYIDANVLGMHGVYNLVKNGNDYTLQTLVPVEWLKKSDNTYPLMIDPTAYGATKMGDFTQTGLPSANMSFTSMNLGSCNYQMNVTVPGKSALTNAYVDVEYSLTYDNTCGAPPLPPPFCTFNMVNMEVVCDACNTSTGPLSCNPASPPYTGTCTTDSNLVPGANAILVNNFVPNYIACVPPQCPDYHLGFTLKNRDSICGDVCGYLCARGNMWRTTVEARQVEGTITQDKTQICAGDSVIFTAHPLGGVPPYSYAWTADGENTFDTIYGTPNYTLYPQNAITVHCYVIDACNFSMSQELPPTVSNDLYLTVSRPSLTISNDTLTCSPALHYQWYLNGSILVGDTFQQLIVTQTGSYSVKDSTVNGCNAISLPFYYSVTGIKNMSATKGKMLIIPNPSNGNFQLSFSAISAGKQFTLRIFDSSGKLVEMRNAQLTGTSAYYTFKPLAKMQAGVYVIQAEFGTEVYREKLLITE